MKRRIATATAVLGMTAAALVAGAPAAQAYPTCNSTMVVGNSRLFFPQIPAYDVAGNKNADCVMGVGSHSWGVVVLQITLNKCYGQRIEVDGIYGQQTRQAVANAQTLERVAFRRNVATDGVYGPQTRRAIHFYGEQVGQGGTNPIMICMRLDGSDDID